MSKRSGIELEQVRFEGDGQSVRLTLLGKSDDPWPVEQHGVEEHGWKREDAPGSLVLSREAFGKPFSMDWTPWVGGGRLLAVMTGNKSLGLHLQGLKSTRSEPSKPPAWSILLAKTTGDTILNLFHHPQPRVASVAIAVGPDGLALEMRVLSDPYKRIPVEGEGWSLERVDGFLRATWGSPDPPIRWNLSPELATGDLNGLDLSEGSLLLSLKPDTPITKEALAASAPVPIGRGFFGVRPLRLPDGAEGSVICGKEGELIVELSTRLPASPRKRK